MLRRLTTTGLDVLRPESYCPMYPLSSASATAATAARHKSARAAAATLFMYTTLLLWLSDGWKKQKSPGRGREEEEEEEGLLQEGAEGGDIIMVMSCVRVSLSLFLCVACNLCTVVASCAVSRRRGHC